MSWKYEAAKKAAKLIGLKKRGKMSADEIIAYKKKQNAKATIPDLRDPEIAIRRDEVMGFPVLSMRHRDGDRKAVLFIIGGGMVSPPTKKAIKNALRFARETGLHVYVPYYPEYPLTKAYEMIHACYQKLLERYRPEQIAVFGTSSGASLALGLVAYINAERLDTPMPGYIMALSPGVCPSTEEEKKRVRELDEKDVAISADYLFTVEEILRHGSDSVPDYMIHSQNGDFSHCPRVTFFYGTDEVLYAMAPSFEAAMKKYGVTYEMVAGEGMFHCYPVFPIVREAKEGWRQMIERMARWGREE